MGIDGAVAHKGIEEEEAPGEVSPRGRTEGWSIYVEEWVELPELLEGEKKQKTLYKMESAPPISPPLETHVSQDTSRNEYLREWWCGNW